MINIPYVALARIFKLVKIYYCKKENMVIIMTENLDYLIFIKILQRWKYFKFLENKKIYKKIKFLS